MDWRHQEVQSGSQAERAARRQDNNQEVCSTWRRCCRAPGPCCAARCARKRVRTVLMLLLLTTQRRRCCDLASCSPPSAGRTSSSYAWGDTAGDVCGHAALKRQQSPSAPASTKKIIRQTNQKEQPYGRVGRSGISISTRSSCVFSSLQCF